MAAEREELEVGGKITWADYVNITPRSSGVWLFLIH